MEMKGARAVRYCSKALGRPMPSTSSRVVLARCALVWGGEPHDELQIRPNIGAKDFKYITDHCPTTAKPITLYKFLGF